MYNVVISHHSQIYIHGREGIDHNQSLFSFSSCENSVRDLHFYLFIMRSLLLPIGLYGVQINIGGASFFLIKMSVMLVL